MGIGDWGLVFNIDDIYFKEKFTSCFTLFEHWHLIGLIGLLNGILEMLCDLSRACIHAQGENHNKTAPKECRCK